MADTEPVRRRAARGGAIAAAIELAPAGRPWSVRSREELADDERDIAVLDIGGVVHRAHVGR